MDFKLISTKEVEKLYPNNYDEKLLKEKGLKDNSMNSNFRYVYSYYRFYLENYLDQTLDIKNIEEKIKKEKQSVNIPFLYKNISALEYKNVFLRNNLFIERIEKEDIKKIQKGIKEKDNKAIFEIVKRTYKEVISYEGKGKIVVYDVNLIDHVTETNALVLGIIVKDKTNKEIKKFIEEKEKEYKEKIGIPVRILMYDYMDIINYEVYSVNNLNEEEEKENEELLKANPKFLPIGSVVILKGAIKRLMIVGHNAEDEETKVIYDYIGYMYPEGYLGKESIVGFNHKDIYKIYSIGLKDTEQKDYLELLKKVNERGII